jgi:hypothetical protein
MKDDLNISLVGAPNTKYEKFFEKFEEINTLDVHSWNVTHLLGYFCKKYQETYNTAYKFKFNSPSPTKCFEVFQMKKLSSLLTSQPKLLRDYIDWIYETKVVKAKRRLTSISFMVHEGLILEYRDSVLMAGQKGEALDRSKSLPDNYKAIFAKAGVTLSTYGELAFLSQMTEQSDEIVNAFNELAASGFNKDILSKIV